jgi:hypothetical protein
MLPSRSCIILIQAMFYARLVALIPAAAAEQQPFPPLTTKSTKEPQAECGGPSWGLSKKYKHMEHYEDPVCVSVALLHSHTHVPLVCLARELWMYACM